MKRAVLTAASLIAALALCSAASAKSKVSYEDAWSKCRTEIAANVPMQDTTTSAHKYTAGAACMKKYGYRLKKSSM